MHPASTALAGAARPLTGNTLRRVIIEQSKRAMSPTARVRSAATFSAARVPDGTQVVLVDIHMIPRMVGLR